MASKNLASLAANSDISNLNALVNTLNPETSREPRIANHFERRLCADSKSIELIIDGDLR